MSQLYFRLRKVIFFLSLGHLCQTSTHARRILWRKTSLTLIWVGVHSVIFHYRYSSQSPDVGKNSDGGISNYWTSDQSFIKKNCYNSRTSNDMDMKVGPVTKLDKRNTATSKKAEYDVMSANCDLLVIFPIYGQFGATWKPDSGREVCKTYIFINSNLLSYKNWQQNLKISNTALILLLWVKVLFLTKYTSFLQKKC